MSALVTNRRWFLRGLRHGIPICAGYFAVAFALGITCRNTGMTAFQSFVMSLMMLASSGEYACVNMIAAFAGPLELITTSLIINMRYFLMSCALSQKISPETKFRHRFFIGYCVTDEIFGLSSAVEGWLCPFYTYGITVISAAGWASGTALGVIVGSILPAWVTTGLGVAMFGMFLAVIIPPAKKDRFIALIVAVSMAASGIFSILPKISAIPYGYRIILLTILIAGAAAFIRPVEDLEDTAEQEVEA